MNNKNFFNSFIFKATVFLLFWILLLVFLDAFKDFLWPLCIAVLFAFLLYPIANFLEKHGVHRIIANILSLVVGLAIIYGIFFFIYKKLRIFMADMPAIEAQAQKNLDEIFQFIENLFRTSTDDEEASAELALRNFFNFGGDNLKQLLSTTTSTLFSVFLMPIFVFFFLFYRDKFRLFIMKMVPENSHAIAKKTIDEVSKVTRKYMSGIFVVVVILCFINSIAFTVVGLKYAILLGVIAALFNFIPWFGTILGYLVPLVVSLLVMDSPRYSLWVIVIFIIVQFTENNILTPSIVGNKMKLNPFIIILGVLFGGAMWGVPGMFIIVPLIGMVKVLCDNVPSLNKYAFIIGDEGTEEHSVNMGRIKRIFRRKK